MDDIEVLELRQEVRENAVAWQMCTVHETKAAIFEAENTSPGHDKIPPSVNKKAWPVYIDEITRLFQICSGEDYHPRVFKEATLCALPKSGKCSRSLPRSYRLISLLFCLGKALEHIVARRLACIALECNKKKGVTGRGGVQTDMSGTAGTASASASLRILR